MKKVKKVNDWLHLVFLNEKFIGEIHYIENWGIDYLARPEDTSKSNKFFRTVKEAKEYIFNK